MIETEDNFEVDWLNERYPFDAEARHKALENKVLMEFNSKKSLTLVDVGAGTGSNCLYFVEQFSSNQQWYLVEQNNDFRKPTIRRLKDYASYHKYDFEKKKDAIKINTPTKSITINIINDSLLNLADILDLKKIDLVLANAVFDLFSEDQITKFVDVITQHNLPLYTTLNYEGMTFFPDDPFDELFINTYHAHMERTQAFGSALGKKTSPFMIDLLTNPSSEIEASESLWKIEPDDIKMHYYLLNFMENALEEMNLEEPMKVNFQKWLSRKKDLIITRQQRLEIRHRDIFAKIK